MTVLGTDLHPLSDLNTVLHSMECIKTCSYTYGCNINVASEYECLQIHTFNVDNKAKKSFHEGQE